MNNIFFVVCPSCSASIEYKKIGNNITCEYCHNKYNAKIHDDEIHLEWMGVEKDRINSKLSNKENLISEVKDEEKNNDRPLEQSQIGKTINNNSTKSSIKNWIENNKALFAIILFFTLPFVFFSTLLLGFGILNSSENDTEKILQMSKPSSITLTLNPTYLPTPSITPTPFLISKPFRFSSDDSWIYTIKDVKLTNSLSQETPRKDYFLVILFDVQNNSGASDCLKMDEFKASDGSNDFRMEYYGLESAKDVYSVDFPGAILGQCIGEDKKESSILVFDIPITENEWRVYFRDDYVRIGKINTILNPPPTATPTPSATFTSTNTPTFTPTALPIGKVLSPNGYFINVRSGPGINYSVAFKLEGQTEFSILNRNEQGDWYQIRTENGELGWIRNDLLETTVESSILSVSTEIFPTLTPSPTFTPTPRPTIPYSQQPPKGNWCAQNSTRGFCVGSLEYRSYIGYTSAGSNSRFITLGIAVKNVGSSDIFVSPLDFTIVMEDGRTYEYAAETFNFNNALQSVTIAPGNTASGGLVFYVPSTVGPRKIISRGGFLESSITIDLYDKPED